MFHTLKSSTFGNRKPKQVTSPGNIFTMRKPRAVCGCEIHTHGPLPGFMRSDEILLVLSTEGD